MTLPLSPSSPIVVPLWRSLVVLLLAGATVGAILADKGINTSSEAGILLDLPTIVAGNYGTDIKVSKSEETILPGDTTFARKVYTTFDNDKINAQIVLSGGDKRSVHRPEICLPGQGWTIQSARVLPIKLKSGQILRATDLLLTQTVQTGADEKRQIQSHYIYWFVGSDKTTHDHFERILLTSMDRVLHNSNHRWAYMVVNATITEGLVPHGKNSAQTVEMLEEFTSEIVPYVLKEKVLQSLPRD